jgi:L-seryl-tRNA(Ser) seleniumtransferase
VTTRELAELGRTRGVPVMEDLGSGSFLDLRPYGLPHEPTAPETVAAGADLVTFSGDKLLGGPQAGIVVGRKALVERLGKNPLNRALRIDKLTLAALEATLRAYEEPAEALATIPTLRMLAEPETAVRRRAQRCLRGLPAAARERLGARVVADRAQVGGGALPTVELPTAALALGSDRHPAEALDAHLRAGRPPIIGRIADDRLLLDCRTIDDAEVGIVVAAVKALV